MRRYKHLLTGFLAVTAMFLLPGCKAKSVKPGINDNFKHMTDVDTWVKRFEGESREIYHQRKAIVAQLGLKPGMDVADIGAGTGLFESSFAHAVEPGGMVYAVDIAPQFIKYINERVAEAGITNVKTVLCEEDSVELPPNSIDLAFICDTYHHFEYPESTMHSLYDALRPGGEVVIVDFDRIEGVSRDWILGHVRLGKEGVIKEVRSFGFELTDNQPNDAFLKENYIIRLRKVDTP